MQNFLPHLPQKVALMMCLVMYHLYLKKMQLGKIIYHLLKRNHQLLQQKRFQLWFDTDDKCWKLSVENRDQIEELDDFDKSYEIALEQARTSRPSKLEVIKENTSHFEIFPRSPI